jgi:hypothetical protein
VVAPWLVPTALPFECLNSSARPLIALTYLGFGHEHGSRRKRDIS